LIFDAAHKNAKHGPNASLFRIGAKAIIRTNFVNPDGLLIGNIFPQLLSVTLKQPNRRLEKWPHMHFGMLRSGLYVYPVTLLFWNESSKKCGLPVNVCSCEF
jgi:hypothetical protein